MSFSSANANGTICTKSTSDTSATFSYQITKRSSAGTITNWDVVSTMHRVAGFIPCSSGMANITGSRPLVIEYLMKLKK